MPISVSYLIRALKFPSSKFCSAKMREGSLDRSWVYASGSFGSLENFRDWRPSVLEDRTIADRFAGFLEASNSIRPCLRSLRISLSTSLLSWLSSMTQFLSLGANFFRSKLLINGCCITVVLFRLLSAFLVLFWPRLRSASCSAASLNLD